MKISHKRSKKIIILPALTLILILVISGVIYATTQPTQVQKAEKVKSATVVPDNTSLAPPTSQESQAGQSAKQDTITKTDNSTEPSNEQSSNISLSATVNGDTVRVIANLSSISTGATCSLLLSKNGATLTKETVEVQALPSYSTCKGWSFATSDLSSGDWTVKVTVNDGQGSQQSSTVKLTIS